MGEEIKIIRKPKVYLVGCQKLQKEASMEEPALNDFIVEHVGEEWRSDTDVDAESLCETAGRLCYMSFGKGRKNNKEYLAHIVEVGHGSVLEHAVWNFIVTGVSRSLTHELIRHRHMSYSQLSQRYVDESDAEFVEPDVIANDPELHALFVDAVSHSQRVYRQLVEKLAEKLKDHPEPTMRRKIARQSARAVLPNACETKIFVTANARALRHFISLRASPAADMEIRSLAIQVLKIMQVQAPNLFDDFTISTHVDGTEIAMTPHPKV